MKRTLATLTLVLALAAFSFAHNGAQHVMATVAAVTTDSITVKTTSGATQTIALTSQTKFVNSGAAATARDLKTGDRVIVEVIKRNGKAQAESVRSGKRASAGIISMPGMAGMKH